MDALNDLLESAITPSKFNESNNTQLQQKENRQHNLQNNEWNGNSNKNKTENYRNRNCRSVNAISYTRFNFIQIFSFKNVFYS